LATTTSEQTTEPGADAVPTGPAEVAAIALGVLMLVGVLRAWLPSLVTVYGDAGSTPAVQLGGFALLWFVLAFAAVPLAAWWAPTGWRSPARWCSRSPKSPPGPPGRPAGAA
jgi:hypothetical protein